MLRKYCYFNQWDYSNKWRNVIICAMVHLFLQVQPWKCFRPLHPRARNELSQKWRRFWRVLKLGGRVSRVHQLQAMPAEGSVKGRVQHCCNWSQPLEIYNIDEIKAQEYIKLDKIKAKRQFLIGKVKAYTNCMMNPIPLLKITEQSCCREENKI